MERMNAGLTTALTPTRRESPELFARLAPLNLRRQSGAATALSSAGGRHSIREVTVRAKAVSLPPRRDCQRSPKPTRPCSGFTESHHDLRIAPCDLEPGHATFCCKCNKRLHGCFDGFMGREYLENFDVS